MNAVTTPDAEESTSSGGSSRVWATKGADFWALLSALLIKTRPETLLEFGGGRSTTFLADYAWRYEKRLITVEQSEEWFKKISEDLRFMGIGRAMVRHVPVEEGVQPTWYNLGRTQRLINRDKWDFVFVDGPNRRARSHPEGQKLVVHAARDARLVIVDDVHRPYNLQNFLDIAERFAPADRFYYAYGRNRLAIGAGEWAPIVRSCFDFLGLAYTNMPPNAGDDTGEDDE